jgi:intraflagellar transport protein 56
VALCYYKLDYYDMAQKVLQVYLQKYPDSATAINLKACNTFHYYKSTSKMAEIKQLIDKASNANRFGNDLIQHNTVVSISIVQDIDLVKLHNVCTQVFRNGEGALQILPGLVDVIPEARLNLVIYYLKQNEIQEAHELINELEPAVPQEYILKGIVSAILGQERNSVSMQIVVEE